MTTSTAFQATDQAKHVITGLVPPEMGEATIRESWRAVTGSHFAALAYLAEKMIRTVILLPVGLLLLLPLFVGKILPFLGKRYVLTNRRLMIVRFGRKTPSREVPLVEIDDIRVQPNSYSEFYRTGTLEVIRGGQVAMRLRGVREPEGFRHAVINARKAWASKKFCLPVEQVATAEKSAKAK